MSVHEDEPQRTTDRSPLLNKRPQISKEHERSTITPTKCKKERDTVGLVLREDGQLEVHKKKK